LRKRKQVQVEPVENICMSDVVKGAERNIRPKEGGGGVFTIGIAEEDRPRRWRTAAKSAAAAQEAHILAGCTLREMDRPGALSGEGKWAVGARLAAPGGPGGL